MERELGQLLARLGELQPDDAGGRQLAVESALTASARRLPERAGEEPEDEGAAWARFLFGVAHRIARGGATMLLQAALSHAEGSAVTLTAERWREKNPDGRLLIRIGRPRKPARPSCLRTIEAHEGAARCLAIDVARKLLLSGGDDGVVRLWDLATGGERGELRSDGKVRALALHPDGKRLVVGASPYVEVWELEGRKRLAQRSSGLGELVHLLLHPDGKRLLVSDGKRVLVRDLERAETLVERELDEETTELQLHADGQHALEVRGFRTLASFSLADGETAERDTDPGHSRARIELERVAVAPHVIYAPDGNHAAAYGTDRRVQLWDLRQRRTVGLLDAHAAPVEAARWLLSGLRLATAAEDGTVRLWDPSLAPAEPDPSAHVEPVVFAGISRDGERAVTVCAAGLLKVWDLDAGICLTTQLPFWRVAPEHRVTAAALLPDGDVLLADDRGALKRVDALSSRNRWRASVVSTLLGAVAEPSGELLVTVEPGMVRFWNARGGTPAGVSPAPSGAAFGRALQALDATRVVATAGSDLVVLDAPSGDPRALLPASTRVRALATNLDGELLAAGDDGAVRWFDPARGCLRTVRAHARPITALAVLPDNQHVVTASLDRSLAVMTPSGARVAAWQLDSVPTVCAAGPNGRIVVADVRGEVTLLQFVV